VFPETLPRIPLESFQRSPDPVAGLKGTGVGSVGNEARHEMGMGQDGEKGERRKEKEGNGRKERAYLRRSAGNIGPLASHRQVTQVAETASFPNLSAVMTKTTTSRPRPKG